MTAMAENDKRDVHLLANSPFIINEQKAAFVISACFHAGYSLARQAADSDSCGTFHTLRYVVRRQRLWPKSGCPHYSGWDTPMWLCHLPTQSYMSVHTNHSSAQNKYTQCDVHIFIVEIQPRHVTSEVRAFYPAIACLWLVHTVARVKAA